jgi:hypothetical protein
MAQLAHVWEEAHEVEARPIAAPAEDSSASRVIRLASLVEVLSSLAEDCEECGGAEAASLIRRYARTSEAGLTWTRTPPEGESPERTLERVIKRVTGPAPWLRRAHRLMLEQRYP